MQAQAYSVTIINNTITTTDLPAGLQGGQLIIQPRVDNYLNPNPPTTGLSDSFLEWSTLSTVSHSHFSAYWYPPYSNTTYNDVIAATSPFILATTTNSGTPYNGIYVIASYNYSNTQTPNPYYPSNDAYVLISISNGQWSTSNATTTTHFTSISVSTTTNKLNLQGYWQNSNTILVTQSTENNTYFLQLYPNSYGGNGFTNSTSTGNFNLDFKIFQQGCTSDTSSTTICTTDQNYTYQAVLYNDHYPNQTYPYIEATSTQLIYPYQGTSTIFAQDFLNQFYNATAGTTTLLSTTNLLSFLNVPQLLQTRIPFNYIFQIASGIKDGIQSSTTNTIPTGNFTWKNTVGGTSTIDMFSPTTIEIYLNPTIITLWRSFLLVILTIDFGYAIYYIIKKHNII